MLMYSGILAGMAQQEAAQQAVDNQRRAWEEQAAYRAAGQESLARLLDARPGRVTWSSTPVHTGRHYGSFRQEAGPNPYRPVSRRSCGAPVTSTEPACTYCLTER